MDDLSFTYNKKTSFFFDSLFRKIVDLVLAFISLKQKSFFKKKMGIERYIFSKNVV